MEFLSRGTAGRGRTCSLITGSVSSQQSGGGETCSFTGGLSDLQSVMMQRRWIIDRSTSQVLTGRRRQITTLFFIPLWQRVQLHVLLIQMVAVIIGAPNIMRPIFACYFPHVRSGCPASTVTTKAENMSSRVAPLSWNHSDGFY